MYLYVINNSLLWFFCSQKQWSCKKNWQFYLHDCIVRSVVF